MNKQFRKAKKETILGLVAVIIITVSLIFIFKGLSPAQQDPSSLQIVAPVDGIIVSPGQTITVIVSVSPSISLTEVVIIGENPIGFSEIDNNPPFELSLTIPPQITPGSYHLTASGVISPGVGIESPPISIRIEKSDSPDQLQVEPNRITFKFIGERVPLRVTGRFSDGSVLDLTDSTLTTFSSTNETVAVISPPGWVTATGPGITTITIQNGHKSIDIQASVPVTNRGDFDGDGDVDGQDLNFILDVIETIGSVPSEGPYDPKDINRDGVINLSDAKASVSNCSRPYCLPYEGATLSVDIDIKPGSSPNSINLGSGGTTPVAILGSFVLDPTKVDPTSVTLAGSTVNLKGKGTPMTSVQDVNGDGIGDLVVHVSTEALQLSETNTEAILEGKTIDGVPIRGSDSVRVVP